MQSETLTLIKQQFFKTKMCPFQKNKNYCLNESNCHYAHSIEELKPMPNLRNTKLCEYVKKKLPCQNPNCKFAHDIEMLKPSVHLATYKSAICSFWGKGKCFNGNKCRFAHGNEDIKTIDDMNKSINNNTKKEQNNNSKGTQIQNKKNYGFNKNDNSNGKNDETSNESVHMGFSASEEFKDFSLDKTVGPNEMKNKNSMEESKKNNSSKVSMMDFDKNDKKAVSVDSDNLKRLPELTHNGDIISKEKEQSLKENKKAMNDFAFVDSRNLVNKHAHSHNNLFPSKMNYAGNSDNDDFSFMNMNDNFKNLQNNRKDIFDKMEHMNFSAYLDNSNEKYSKMISYLVKENAILKETLRNDFCDLGVLDPDMKNANLNNHSFETLRKNTTSSSRLNYDDITKYLLNEDNDYSDKYMKNSDSKCRMGFMNVSTYEDTNNIDDNYSNIIKTIDDILISHNVDSFANIKSENEKEKEKEKEKDSGLEFDKPAESVNEKSGTSEIMNSYDYFFRNLKSFESDKNLCSDSQSNSNSNSILTLEKKNSKDAFVLEQLLQQNVHNDDLTFNSSYFCDNIKHNTHANRNHFIKGNSFPQDYLDSKDREDIMQKTNLKMYAMNHQMNHLNLDGMDMMNVESKGLQKLMYSKINKKDDYAAMVCEKMNMKPEDALLKRNLLNSLQHTHSNNSINNPMNFYGMNQSRNALKEKNTKLNSTDQENLLLNDDSLNLEKLLEMTSDKAELIKKLKIFLSNELKNSENMKYSSNTKINHFQNYENNNSMMNSKKNFINDGMYLPQLNLSTNESGNVNIPMNMNNDLLGFDSEIHNEKNIWNNMKNSSQNNSSSSYNFGGAPFNKYMNPNYPSEWLNGNNQNMDFFNLSKSINAHRMN